MYDPGYEFSCDHCGTEMEDAVGGYWKDDVRYCALCAWDLFDQPKPITAYDIWRREKDKFELMKKEEDIQSTRLTCEYTEPEKYDPKYNYDSLNDVRTRSYDWDPQPEFYTDPWPISNIIQCDCCDGFEDRKKSCVEDGTVYCNDCFKDLFNLEMPNLEDSRERYSDEDIWDELARKIFTETAV